MTYALIPQITLFYPSLVDDCEKKGHVHVCGEGWWKECHPLVAELDTN